MEPIVTGHRRRKSSLMNPISTSPTSTRPRPQSTLNSPLPIGPGSLSGANASVPEQSATGTAGLSISTAELGGSGNGFASASSPTPSRYIRDSYDNYSDQSYSDADVRDDEETGLTKKQRKTRQKRRRRNTLLDQRIVRDEKNLSPGDDHSKSDKNVVKTIAINLGLIFLWYLFSLSISLVSQCRQPLLWLLVSCRVMQETSTTRIPPRLRWNRCARRLLTDCLVQQMDV